MKKTWISETPQLIGKTVELYGWAHTIRDHKKVVFIDLRDVTGIIQMVGVDDIGRKMAEASPESVLKVKGLIKERPSNMVNEKIATGTVEFEVEDVTILSSAEQLPFEINKEDLDVTLPILLDYRALTLRNPKVRQIFKLQEKIIDAFREACKSKDFTEFQAPILIPETAEGGAEVFEVKYFDHKAYLSQSPQFYKQIMVGVFERVFTVNKTLRAEPSVTTRHLTEATTLDVEFGFIDDWQEIMDMAEFVIKFILDEAKKDCASVFEMHGVELPVTSVNIPRIKLREGQEIIFKRTGRDNRSEPDLEPEDERELCRWAQEEHGVNMVFVTHYPVSKRPFYVMEDPEDLGFTLSFDLLGYGLEWLTGGQRVNNYDVLMKKAKEKNVDVEKSEIYLQAFRYGMPPEGGFSFGSERIVMRLLGLKNIREATLFPRDMERIDVRL